jgi:hypothetical protein
MTISLLDLPSGVVSLEFDAADAARLGAALAAHLGPVHVLEQSALYDLVEFGSERFLYYHEWDPCLISTSAAGAIALRRLCAALSEPDDRGDPTK